MKKLSSPSTMTIQLEPKDALSQVLRSIKDQAPHAECSYPITSTWTSVLRRSADFLAPSDSVIELMPPKTPAHRARIRALAQEINPDSSSKHAGDQFPGLRLRNAGNIDNLPPPLRASAAYRQKLKENLHTLEKPLLDPHVKTITLRIESQKLATICGLLELSAIDGADHDPRAMISSTQMLIDTGAQVSLITDDILSRSFRDYLMDPIHDPYRSEDGTKVQVDATFSFADRQINMACIFQVVSRTRIPNERVGIILGQHSCLDHMVFTMKPRLFIPSISEDDTVWGDMKIHQYINHIGQAVDMS